MRDKNGRERERGKGRLGQKRKGRRAWHKIWETLREERNREKREKR